jgi:SAM-dependent methyltransferase
LPSIYDHPRYYDLLFGWDRSGEAQFYDRLFRTHGVPARGRVLEVACGTGQVAIHLARLGWRVSGLDLRPEMLSFLRQRAARYGVAIHTLCADMTDFEMRRLQDAAYCPFGSFHLLPDDDRALAHLDSAAQALTADGIYVLDLTLRDKDSIDPPIRPWTMRCGHLRVEAGADGIVAADNESGESLRLDWGGAIRRYNVEEMRSLFERSPFALESVYPEQHDPTAELTTFDIQKSASAPAQGRNLVVLRRR